MPRTVAGYYVASPEGILAAVNVEAEETRSNEILFHEYAHHFMMQYMTGVYPAWFIEGFAEYLGTAKLEERYIEIGRHSAGRIYSVTEGSWLPLDRVLSAGPGGLSPQDGAAYYAQAWLMTHYFFSTPERHALMRRYFAASGSQTPVQALTTATGMAPDRFARELRGYIAGRTISYRRMPRGGPGEVSVAVTTLPRSADDVLLHAAALRVGLAEDAAPAILARIRAAAQRHGTDPLARRTLAHAELFHGDRAAALRLLEGLLAEIPNDAELMYLRGRLHLENAERNGDWETEARAARQWFTRAHRADPSHFQSLYRFAQSQRQGPEARSENTGNVLMLAHQLAPQVTEIRLNAASVQIARGDIGRAEVLLRPLFNDPHRPELAERAREMIRLARSGSLGAARASSGEGAPARETAPAN